MNGRGSAGGVDRDQDDLGFGDGDPLGGVGHPALGFDQDADGDRRPAEPDGLGVEADDVAEVHRRVELDLAHRLGHVAVRRRLARFDGRGQVDVRQDHAAEDRTVGVGVLGQQQDLDRGNAVAHDAILAGIIKAP